MFAFTLVQDFSQLYSVPLDYLCNLHLPVTSFLHLVGVALRFNMSIVNSPFFYSFILGLGFKIFVTGSMSFLSGLGFKIFVTGSMSSITLWAVSVILTGNGLLHLKSIHPLWKILERCTKWRVGIFNCIHPLRDFYIRFITEGVNIVFRSPK